MATQARRLPLPTLAGRLPQYIAPAFAILLVGMLVIWLGVNFIKTPSEFYQKKKKKNPQNGRAPV